MKITSCTEWLFYHLWKKNKETNLSCPGIFILDTIIYRWSKPNFWYLNSCIINKGILQISKEIL